MTTKVTYAIYVVQVMGSESRSERRYWWDYSEQETLAEIKKGRNMPKTKRPTRIIKRTTTVVEEVVE